MLRLRFLRLERRLSQRQLAALTNLTQPELSRIESGRVNPTDRELKLLAGVLGCPPERLMTHVSAASLPAGAEARDAYQREKDGRR